MVIQKQSFFILMLGAKWTENNGDDNDEDEDSYNISKTSNAIQRLCLARTKFWDYKNYSEGEHLVNSEGRILINNVHDLQNLIIHGYFETARIGRMY